MCLVSECVCLRAGVGESLQCWGFSFPLFNAKAELLLFTSKKDVEKEPEEDEEEDLEGVKMCAIKLSTGGKKRGSAKDDGVSSSKRVRHMLDWVIALCCPKHPRYTSRRWRAHDVVHCIFVCVLFYNY